MRINEILRRKKQSSEARAAEAVKTEKQDIDIVGSRKTGIAFIFRPAFRGQFLTLTAEQAYNHGLTVMASAVACGAKHDPYTLAKKIVEIGKILDADEAKARERE